MKAIALANRLARDLDEKSFIDLAADTKLLILDALNGGLQILDELAPEHSKKTTGSLYLEPSETIEVEVIFGDTALSGVDFLSEQYGRTIRLQGDAIDNQIAGANELLHPYTGATGTVIATIYSDAVALPEIYSQLAGDPTIIETGRLLSHDKPERARNQKKAISEPTSYWVEANARNQNPHSPAVVRFNSLPDRSYRIEAEVILAPARISFIELVSGSAEIPIRSEHIESHLFPIARGIMTASNLWSNQTTKTSAIAASESARLDYENRLHFTLATPNNRVGTPHGF